MRTYRGRFAPSPTGSLHFGSLVAAVGSYLDAKHHHGTWLVRMEDVDTPRCVAGADQEILRTLAVFGLHSDEAVQYQSQRTTAYESARLALQTAGAVYPCTCTRREVADSAMQGVEGFVYAGTCRDKTLPITHLSLMEEATKPIAWRIRSEGGYSSVSLTASPCIAFDDALQGHQSQHVANDIGDFVVQRADGLFAYQLAVVVDDAFQGITHVVRGADLLASTPRQIHLQRLLNLPTPHYLHLPIALNAAGEKLSKQTLAAPVAQSQPVLTLLRVLDFLQQHPPAELAYCEVHEVLQWAVQHWHIESLKSVAARFS
jgi:glutamyl-Q tRNA(Asp) synthetase